MKRIIAFSLSLLPIALVAQVLPDSLQLEAFLQLAEARSLDRQQAETDLELAELDFRLFRASQRPQLLASANLPNYQRTVSEIVQPNGTVLFQPIRNNNSALGLRLTQAIPATGGTLFVQSNLQRFDDFEGNNSLYNGIPVRIGLAQPLFGFNEQKWAQQLAPVRQPPDCFLISFMPVRNSTSLLPIRKAIRSCSKSHRNDITWAKFRTAT